MGTEPRRRHATDAAEDVFTDLLLGSYHLHPDAVPEAAAAAVARLGGRDAVLLLVDLDQRRLAPLGTEHPALAVDGTAAGQAFRTEAPVEVPVDGGVRLWLPLLDSAERLGVLGVTVDEVGPQDRRRWQALVSLLGELVTSKAAYGDGITQARRSRPTSLAAELRWALLPPLTFVSPEVTVSGILEPAYEIAGDTFDYAVNGSTVHLAILDAMGHGLEASRMANLAVTTYRHSRRQGRSLAEMVAAVDEVIDRQFGPSKFVTGQLATLDTDTGVLSLLNLGHPLPLLLRGDQVVGQVQCTPGSPAGLGWPPATTTEVQLQPGDAVLLHTDGITEARGAGPEEFGQERFEALVTTLLRGRERPAELLRRVVHEVLAFQDFRPRDDATLLLVGWRLPDPTVVGARPPAA